LLTSFNLIYNWDKYNLSWLENEEQVDIKVNASCQRTNLTNLVENKG